MNRKMPDDTLDELDTQFEELWREQNKKTSKERDLTQGEYRRNCQEIIDKKSNLKLLREQEMMGTSFLIYLHDVMNSIGTALYQLVRPLKLEVTPEEARQNMHDFILKEFLPVKRYDSQRNEIKEVKPLSLEERLQTMGEYYIPYDDLVKIDLDTLCQVACQYDGKGIIANPKETLAELVYRGNSLLYLSQQQRKQWGQTTGIDLEVERKTWMVRAKRSPYYKGRVSQKDLQKALKRVPYYMDLSWVSAYVKDDFIIPALGVTFTLPNYNGLGFIQVLPSYKSRDKFLEILSHELVHAGTVYWDSRIDYLETKAYHVGRGSLVGEYAVAVHQRPHPLLLGLNWGWDILFPWFPLPERSLKHFTKIKTAWQIAATTATFRDVERKLTCLYGRKGNYILGRLSGDEIEEFHYTNDIPARVARKETLKWRIMRTNFEVL